MQNALADPRAETNPPSRQFQPASTKPVSLKANKEKTHLI